ncbi:hypothetical protein CP974_11685 [Streptomyces fradiae ATCC 10745 = DSM 40063]|nr:hypothetical protein CP974_11685 [Streptomyces fradiae ATCC 10745 = DSM 40063]
MGGCAPVWGPAGRLGRPADGGRAAMGGGRRAGGPGGRGGRPLGREARRGGGGRPRAVAYGGCATARGRTAEAPRTGLPAAGRA